MYVLEFCSSEWVFVSVSPPPGHKLMAVMGGTAVDSLPLRVCVFLIHQHSRSVFVHLSISQRTSWLELSWTSSSSSSSADPATPAVNFCSFSSMDSGTITQMIYKTWEDSERSWKTVWKWITWLQISPVCPIQTIIL